MRKYPIDTWCHQESVSRVRGLIYENFLFMAHAVEVRYKNSLPSLRAQRLSLSHAFSKLLMVLYFTFPSCIHFELIFYKAWNWSRFIFSICSSALFVGKAAFPPLACFCTFVKGHLAMFVSVYFWVDSISLIFVLLLQPCIVLIIVAVSLKV